MNKLLTLICILSLPVLMMGQIWCDMEPTPEEYERYMAERPNYSANKAGPAIIYIPIKYHLIANDSGSGHLSFRDMLKAHCNNNADYSGTDLRFYIYEGVDVIANSNYYEFEDGYIIRQIAMDHNVAENVVDIYATKTPTSALCGRSAFTWSNKPHSIIMANSCMGLGDRTFPHEMGHYFNLLHPFSGWSGNNPENVTRSGIGKNCDTRGDRFCDTNADYLDYRWACGMTHTQKDKYDSIYHPDKTLIMSYASDQCVERFSPDQELYQNYIAALQGTNGRSELTEHDAPYDQPVAGTPTLMLPVQNEIDVPANFVTFSWSSIPGATMYHLIATRFNINTDGYAAVDILVNDTTYTAIRANFDEYKTYRWIVKGFNETETCAGYSPLNSFKTGESILISGINDQGATSAIRAYPNPVSRGQEIRIELNSSGHSHLNVFNMTGELLIKVPTHGNTKIQLSTGKLAAGIYSLSVDGRRGQHRFIVLD